MPQSESVDESAAHSYSGVSLFYIFYLNPRWLGVEANVGKNREGEWVRRESEGRSQ